MTLVLDAEEQEILVGILSRRLLDIRVEIRHTTSRDFRSLLRREEQLIERLLERLGQPPAPAGSPGGPLRPGGSAGS